MRFAHSEKTPQETVSEISWLLANNDARRVSTDYDDEGNPEAVTFALQINARLLSFRLEPDPKGMQKAMKAHDDTPESQCSFEQAERTAWKHKLALLETILAHVKANQARLDQMLLGMGVTPDGRTVYDRLVEDQRLLEDGTSPV